MSKRRMRRLRGRALAAAAAQSAALRREVEQLNMRIRGLSSHRRAAENEAANEIIRRLAADEGFKERLARSYTREAADVLGRMLGADFGRQFEKNRPIFEQAERAQNTLLKLAQSSLDIRGSLIVTDAVYLQADFTIPPLHRAFRMVT